MKKTLQLEELAMFAGSILLFSLTNYSWWWYVVLILTPDIGMLGYVFGTRVGAITYNIFHHKGLAVLILVSGFYLKIPWMELAGIILFGHASMDRIVGYGLKYPDHFKHTHLDAIT